jgi:uncharacterized protein (DUF302 family)
MDEFSFYLDSPYKQALEIVEAALKAEGFGIITRIDVQQTMKQKLNVEFRPFMILGACNPPIAHRVLEHDPSIALLLPCNVSVETTEDDRTLVRIADPAQMLLCSHENDEVLAELATEVRKMLLKVAARLRGIILPHDPASRSWDRLSSEHDL